MKKILYILIIIILASCNENKKPKLNLNSKNSKSKKYSLVEVTEDEFEDAEDNYKDRILYDSTKFHKKNGHIKLPLENKSSYITFSDTLQNTDSDQMESYDYIGQFENIGFYIVEGSFWEHYECYLIDKINGKKTTIWNKPSLSPNSKYISNLSMGYGLEGVENGLQIWEVKRNGNSKTIKKKVEIDQEIWVPKVMVWENNKSLILKVLKVEKYVESNGEFDDDDYHYLRLTLK